MVSVLAVCSYRGDGRVLDSQACRSVFIYQLGFRDYPGRGGDGALARAWSPHDSLIHPHETSAEGDRRALYSPSTWHKKADALSMKTTKRIASQADARGEQQLAGFIKKFDPKNAALIRSVRKVLRERLPTASELVYDNYNFFVIGYCSTERPTDCVLSIAAGANGVGLSFYYGATLPDPHKLLLGSGSQNRFIRIESAATLARPEVEELIAAAIAQAERPLPESGRGKLVIRSISKKQKPRRKASD
jgi:hypothetical protein